MNAIARNIVALLFVSLPICFQVQAGEELIDEDVLADIGLKIVQEEKVLGAYHVQSWKVINKQAVILEGEPQRTFLVELKKPCDSLLEAKEIHWSAPVPGGEVSAVEGDSIKVWTDSPQSGQGFRGGRCQIGAIYRLERIGEQAASQN